MYDYVTPKQYLDGIAQISNDRLSKITVQIKLKQYLTQTHCVPKGKAYFFLGRLRW
jgi:hypothetical protein